LCHRKICKLVRVANIENVLTKADNGYLLAKGERY